MATSPRFESFANEILQNIAYHAVARTFLGPPTELIPLLCTCRTFNSALSFTNTSHLYADIFRFKFDSEACARRLGPRWLTSTCLSVELRKRFAAIKRLRRGEIHVPDLWTAYLMMLESDGRNEAQLIEWVAIDKFLRKSVLEQPTTLPPFYHNIESTALILWLLWMTTDADSVRRESPRDSQSLRMIIRQFLIRGFLYPSSFAPAAFFHLPICEHLKHTAPCSTTRSTPDAAIVHYSHYLRICAPLLTVAAQLLTVVRVETSRDQHPPVLRSNVPENRAVAHALGVTGPTVDDIYHFHYNTRTHIPARIPLHAPPDDTESRDPKRSRRYDEEWSRLVSCCTPWMEPTVLREKVYTPGALSGDWAGHISIPAVDPYWTAILNAHVPAHSVDLHHLAFYCTLQEHHCLVPDIPLAGGSDDSDMGDDILNAWLPRGLTMRQLEDAIEVFDPVSERQIRYETFLPGSSASYSRSASAKLQTPWLSMDHDEEIAENNLQSVPESPEHAEASYFDNDNEYTDDVEYLSTGVADILITGETTERHREAWGHFNFIGRARSWDGFIVLLRIPADVVEDAYLGRWVFTGYLHDRNFVGRWRETSTSLDVVGFEGGFVLCKTQEA